MLNYIKSEVYRVLRCKSTYLFIAVCSLLLISSNVVLALVKQAEDTFPYANTAFSFGNVYSNMSMVFLLCVMVSGFIFNNENNNHTFKNCVSYGIPRMDIYFGKLIIQMIYGIIAFSTIIGAHVASAYLLLENSGPKVMEVLLHTCFAALPLFLFVIAVTNCFSFAFESSGAAVAATAGVIVALPLITEFLGMKFEVIQKLANILPWNLITLIKFDYHNTTMELFWKSNGYLFYWLAGILQMCLFILIGYSMFSKKEIK